mgnify:CR=1 FL=1
MIGAQGRVPVFAYRRPVDLRKGFEGLSALVQQALGRDPLSGALYLFTNRRRTTAKVLQFDGTGLTLYIKRLARGRFAALWDGDEATALSLSRPELDGLLVSPNNPEELEALTKALDRGPLPASKIQYMKDLYLLASGQATLQNE